MENDRDSSWLPARRRVLRRSAGRHVRGPERPSETSGRVGVSASRQIAEPAHFDTGGPTRGATVRVSWGIDGNLGGDGRGVRARARSERSGEGFPLRWSSQYRSTANARAVMWPIGLRRRFRPSPGEIERGGEVTHGRLAVGLQRRVAGGDAGKGRQIEALGDESQDRGRVVGRVVDETASSVG